MIHQVCMCEKSLSWQTPQWQSETLREHISKNYHFVKPKVMRSIDIVLLYVGSTLERVITGCFLLMAPSIIRLLISFIPGCHIRSSPDPWLVSFHSKHLLTPAKIYHCVSLTVTEWNIFTIASRILYSLSCSSLCVSLHKSLFVMCVRVCEWVSFLLLLIQFWERLLSSRRKNATEKEKKTANSPC